MANSVDPDQMPQNAASDLGLHRLQRLICPNTKGYYGNGKQCRPCLEAVFHGISSGSILFVQPSLFEYLLSFQHLSERRFLLGVLS